jgi:exodeoxyribonuclease V alpha subunit
MPDPSESAVVEVDPFGRDVVLSEPAHTALGVLDRAGLLAAADVHVARTLGRLGGEDDEAVLLALALAVRGVRLGSSCIDLAVVVDDLRTEAPDLVWPAFVDDVPAWWQRVVASPLATGRDRVLVAEEPLLHLPRYHGLEVSLCERLAERLALAPPVVDEGTLGTDLDRLFGAPGFDEQRAAAERAVRSWTSVLTGGPGTGKTTTIARLLAALASQHAAAGHVRPLSVGLAAPTGKAAARMREAIRSAAGDDVFTADERAWLESLDAVTLHRLLGPRPDHRTAFRHHAGQKLPYDVVVVDETSMVALLMTERLVQAVPSSCRLVLVGDAEQLASVETGAVLRDVVDGLGGDESPVVTHLRQGHRFDGGIGDLAAAVVAGDADAALEVLTSGVEGVTLRSPDDLDDVVAGRPAEQARAVAVAAQQGDVAAALAALGEHRLLCAHRDGPFGVSHWNERLEREVRTFPDPSRPWFAGRPVLVTRNDASLRVNNGDVGVTLDDGLRLVVHLDTGTTVSSSRLASTQSAYASTVHRSQGSEFDHVTLLLPDEDSLVLTRELLYTAVTRARTGLTVVATPDVVRRAVERRTARASGVARRLAALVGDAGVGRS